MGLLTPIQYQKLIEVLALIPDTQESHGRTLVLLLDLPPALTQHLSRPSGQRAALLDIVTRCNDWPPGLLGTPHPLITLINNALFFVSGSSMEPTLRQLKAQAAMALTQARASTRTAIASPTVVLPKPEVVGWKLWVGIQWVLAAGAIIACFVCAGNLFIALWMQYDSLRATVTSTLAGDAAVSDYDLLRLNQQFLIWGLIFLVGILVVIIFGRAGIKRLKKLPKSIGTWIINQVFHPNSSGEDGSKKKTPPRGSVISSLKIGSPNIAIGGSASAGDAINSPALRRRSSPRSNSPRPVPRVPPIEGLVADPWPPGQPDRRIPSQPLTTAYQALLTRLGPLHHPELQGPARELYRELLQPRPNYNRLQQLEHDFNKDTQVWKAFRDFQTQAAVREIWDAARQDS